MTRSLALLLPLALGLAACRPASPTPYPPATVVTTAAQAAQGSADVAGTYALQALGTHSLPWSAGLYDGCPVWIDAGALTLTAEGRYRLALTARASCDPAAAYAAAATGTDPTLSPHTAYGQAPGTAPATGPGTARSTTPSPPDPGLVGDRGADRSASRVPGAAPGAIRGDAVSAGVVRTGRNEAAGEVVVEGYYALMGNAVRFGNAMVVTRDIQAPQQVSGAVELAEAVLPYGRFDARGTVRDVVLTVTLRDLTSFTFTRPESERPRPATPPSAEPPPPVPPAGPGEDGEVPTLPETDEPEDHQPGPPVG